MKRVSANNILFGGDYRTMTSGWQGAPYFRRYGLELVSKPAISLKKSWGGYRRTTLRWCAFAYFSSATALATSLRQTVQHICVLVSVIRFKYCVSQHCQCITVTKTTTMKKPLLDAWFDGGRRG